MIQCKCGRILDQDEGEKAFIKTEKNNKRVIIESFLCDSCNLWHRTNNLLAYNEDQKNRWLQSK